MDFTKWNGGGSSWVLRLRKISVGKEKGMARKGLKTREEKAYRHEDPQVCVCVTSDKVPYCPHLSDRICILFLSKRLLISLRALV